MLLEKMITVIYNIFFRMYIKSFLKHIQVEWEIKREPNINVQIKIKYDGVYIGRWWYAPDWYIKKMLWIVMNIRVNAYEKIKSYLWLEIEKNIPRNSRIVRVYFWDYLVSQREIEN